MGNTVLSREWALGAKLATVDGFTLVGSDGKDRVEQHFYDNNGRITQSIDANHSTTHYSYDENGNIARMWQQVSDADGSQHVRDVRYRYDVNGHQIITMTLERDATWVNERAIYNSFGELTQTDYNGKFAIKYDYDSEGRVWRHQQLPLA